MSFEVHTPAERAASMSSVDDLLRRTRCGPGPHMDWCREIDARLTEIEAFDARQAKAARPTPQASTPPRPTDPRDAVLSAMRAINRSRPTT